jgi:(2Fe-2S) ferredoxin
MGSKDISPFICHVFVCTNDRQGKRKSCADGNSQAVRSALKQIAKDRGWKPKVRVSQSGCLGVCANGPNVMIYPQKVWFSEVGLDDVEKIAAAVDGILSGNE